MLSSSLVTFWKHLLWRRNPHRDPKPPIRNGNTRSTLRQFLRHAESWHTGTDAPHEPSRASGREHTRHSTGAKPPGKLGKLRAITRRNRIRVHRPCPAAAAFRVLSDGCPWGHGGCGSPIAVCRQWCDVARPVERIARTPFLYCEQRLA